MMLVTRNGYHADNMEPNALSSHLHTVGFDPRAPNHGKLSSICVRWEAYTRHTASPVWQCEQGSGYAVSGSTVATSRGHEKASITQFVAWLRDKRHMHVPMHKYPSPNSHRRRADLKTAYLPYLIAVVQEPLGVHLAPVGHATAHLLVRDICRWPTPSLPAYLVSLHLPIRCARLLCATI